MRRVLSNSMKWISALSFFRIWNFFDWLNPWREKKRAWTEHSVLNRETIGISTSFYCWICWIYWVFDLHCHSSCCLPISILSGFDFWASALQLPQHRHQQTDSSIQGNQQLGQSVFLLLSFLPFCQAPSSSPLSLPLIDSLSFPLHPVYSCNFSEAGFN